jgi:exodeoxyribonuclease-1
METLYWHDYETFGRDPARDRLAQFAGIRTDTDLKIIGKPLVKYCKISNDIVPDPGACLVTGITPQYVNKHGISEAKFMAAIHKEFIQEKTCTVGYNSANFDDEFTRYALYRNFYNPYDHHDERKGNSRWDLINVVRLVRAFHPEGPIAWPTKDNGKYSTRLEDLTAANEISHDAHDALADVRATIDLARLIKSHYPRLYDYCYKHRKKKKVSELLGVEKKRLKDPQLLLHVNNVYGSEANYLAVVYPVAMHPTKSNTVICYNVMHDPEPLLELTARELRERLFTKDLGEERVALHAINIGKCPVLVPLDKISSSSAELLNLDKRLCKDNAQRIAQKGDAAYVAQVAYQKTFEERTDPELMLYDGFLEREDKRRLTKVRETPAKQLHRVDFGFEDKRLPELLFRYRARNFPSTLLVAERKRWAEYRQNRLYEEDGGNSLTLEQYLQKIADKLQEEDLSDRNQKLLKELEKYAKALQSK